MTIPGIALPGISGGGSPLQTESRVVAFLTSETILQKQSKIDAVPRHAIQGISTTFQFQDGTHIFDAPLAFDGFTYPIIVQGNPGESGAHTNQAVVISSSNSDNDLLFTNCKKITVKNLKHSNSNVTKKDYIKFTDCEKCYADGNYYSGASILNAGVAVGYWASLGTISNNYFNNVAYCIYGTKATRIESDNNITTGASPLWGLVTTRSATIGKVGTQPTSVNGDSGTTGGVIR